MGCNLTPPKQKRVYLAVLKSNLVAVLPSPLMSKFNVWKWTSNTSYWLHICKVHKQTNKKVYL